MKHFYLLLALLTVQQFSAQQIPPAKEVPLTLQKHKIKYADNFAWMEDLDSDEVKRWINGQNLAADAHLTAIRKHHSSESKIKEYRYLTSNGIPTKRGKYYYSRIVTGRNSPMSLFYRKSLGDQPIELVNLSRIYKNNQNAIIWGYYPSPTSETLAYKVSPDGSDRQEVRFVKFAGVKNLADVLKDVKFSNIEWNGDDGIFYTRNSNVRRFDRDSTFHVYYHKLGTPQESDKLIFDASTIDGSVGFFTEGRKLILEVSNGEETEQTFSYVDLNDASMQVKPLFKDSVGISIHTIRNGKIYYSTPESDWGDLRSMDFAIQKDVKVVVPQIYMNLLTAVNFIDDYIICHYKAIGKNFINIHDKDSKFIRKFEAVSGMDIDVKFVDPTTKDLYVSFYSYTMPFHNYTLNINTGERKPYISNILNHKPQLFPTGYFVTKNITYKSRDNQDIPITIVHKKGVELDGNNPTLLEAYGGFGSVSGPSYDTGVVHFLEQGGVYAYAEIRGGGERGQKWHRDGRGLKKINTFNDFIDAAEFLIAEKYTSPSRLGISGTSQGGLLIGVAMTMRPELFKVAIPRMGVYDMAIFTNYSVGKRHRDEYGNPEKEDHFDAMMAYSPYHNIKDDVNYPTTIIITSENDDRVPPVHSYKFAARLQNRAAQKNPVYMKSFSGSGHSGNVATHNSFYDQEADFYNFLIYHLNK